MMIIAGENVFPREIEEVLNAHPAIAGSAILGQRDDLRGEVPIAFIEFRPEQQADDATLRAWCRDHLAGYKCPRDIRVVEKLPRSPTGKIMRRQLEV
ncbi:MAG: hypothetical protein IT440_06570 [Phycisphaeraceae bacterium]|nr:hypothetical protein [Phycisphaeraceae bacterium]